MNPLRNQRDQMTILKVQHYRYPLSRLY